MKKETAYEPFVTNVWCPRCKTELFTSDIEGYAFVCPKCDENFYTIETGISEDDTISIQIPKDRCKLTSASHIRQWIASHKYVKSVSVIYLRDYAYIEISIAPFDEDAEKWIKDLNIITKRDKRP